MKHHMYLITVFSIFNPFIASSQPRQPQCGLYGLLLYALHTIVKSFLFIVLKCHVSKQGYTDFVPLSDLKQPQAASSGLKFDL